MWGMARAWVAAKARRSRGFCFCFWFCYWFCFWFRLWFWFRARARVTATASEAYTASDSPVRWPRSKGWGWG